MKYLLITIVTLMMTFLIGRVFVALGIIDFERHGAKNQVTQKEVAQSGKSLYLVYCASCHGADGRGNNNKAQNHTKRISKESVLYAIRNGANNFVSLYPRGMPAGLLGEKDAEEVAAYVADGMRTSAPNGWKKCTPCHDASGEGIAFVAPNLKTYSDEFVIGVLRNGKKGAIGTMPHFQERLSDMQIKALATHIRSLEK
jgi:cytochrome c oxidase cbb3-type subunit 3